jgi:hypothetical protein
MNRLPTESLFRIGPTGLEPISDETLNGLLDASERQALQGYRQAVAEEMLQHPEAS